MAEIVADGAPLPHIPDDLTIPQFLLDDIINTANDEARQSIDAMEQFLQRWADARASNTSSKSSNPDWDPTQEIEQGLVALGAVTVSDSGRFRRRFKACFNSKSAFGFIREAGV